MLFIPFLKGGIARPILFVGWTLNYEMFFYLLFTIGLLFPYRLGVSLVVATIFILSALGLLFHFSDTHVNFYTSPRMLEFAAGMGIGLLHPNLPRPQSLGLKLATVGIFVISVACLVILPIYAGGAALATFACLVSASLVMTSALILEKAGWSTDNPIIINLGNASYSLYLTHAFIALAAVKFFLSHGGHLWLAAIMLPMTYVGSVIVAFCAYKYVERPITGRLLVRPVGAETGGRGGAATVSGDI